MHFRCLRCSIFPLVIDPYVLAKGKKARYITNTLLRIVRAMDAWLLFEKDGLLQNFLGYWFSVLYPKWIVYSVSIKENKDEESIIGLL